MHTGRIVFFGLSKMMMPSLSWLESINYPYLIITNSVQAGKLDQMNIGAVNQRIQIADSLVQIREEWVVSDLGISVGAPWLFTESFIAKFPAGRLLNLHGSQLPMYRGGNLFSWYVLNKVRVGICLIHHVVEALDEGDVISYQEFLYRSTCRKPIDYIEDYESQNATFLRGFIEAVIEDRQSLRGHHQPNYLSTYWPRLKSELNGWIDWNWKGNDLELFISAFDSPYPGALTTWRSKTIHIKEVLFQPGNNHHPFQNGIVIRNSKKWLTVAVQGGELIICYACIDSGESIIDRIKLGDRLLTPRKLLDEAKRRVVKYSDGLRVQPDLD